LHSQGHNLSVPQISQRRTFFKGARQFAQLKFPFGNGAFCFTSGVSRYYRLSLGDAQFLVQRIELDLVSINRFVIHFRL
jgi:hypothetical protein